MPDLLIVVIPSIKLEMTSELSFRALVSIGKMRLLPISLRHSLS